MSSSPRQSAKASSEPLGSMPETSSVSYADHSRLASAFDRFASQVTRWGGSPVAFCMALFTVLVWAISGPFFNYSEKWQLVINTGTTIVTFLMVFLIQQSQNKDSVAIHLKLNELLASNRHASNRMIGIEQLDEQDLREVALFYVKLAEKCNENGHNKQRHSIDDEGITCHIKPEDNNETDTANNTANNVAKESTKVSTKDL